MQSSLDSVMSPCFTLMDIPPISRDPSGFDDGTLTQPSSPVRKYRKTSENRPLHRGEGSMGGVLVTH